MTITLRSIEMLRLSDPDLSDSELSARLGRLLIDPETSLQEIYQIADVHGRGRVLAVLLTQDDIAPLLSWIGDEPFSHEVALIARRLHAKGALRDARG